MNSQKRPYYSLLLLGCIAVLTAFFISRLPLLEFDYDFEALFPNENEELKHYERYRQQFEYDHEFVLIALENESGIFRKNFLFRIDSLYQKLKALPDVKEVQSPTRISRFHIGGLVPLKIPLMHLEDEFRYPEDSARIFSDPNLVGGFFAEDAKSLCLYVKTEEGLSKSRSDLLANRIEECLTSFSRQNVHYAGRIFAQKVYLEQLQKEFLLFIALAFVLVLIFLWFSFKNTYGTLVPITVVVVSVIWTLGLMQVLGKSIDLMCSMLPTMIFVAGMSDVTHFFSAYLDERKKNTSEKIIFSKIRKEVAYPTFLTLLTTVIGFLSLLFSSIQPVRDFGVYTSLGVAIAYLLTYSMLPALLKLHPPLRLLENLNKSTQNYGSMQKGIRLIFRNQKKIVGLSVLVLLVSFYGMTQLQVNNTLLEDLNDRVKIKQDFTYFDQHYSGARPLELEVRLKDSTKSILDYQNVVAIQQLDSFVRKTYQAGFVLSIANVIKSMNAQLNEDAGNFPSEEDYQELRLMLEKNRKNKELTKVLDPNGRNTRISGKFKDIGSAEVNERNEELKKFLHSSGIENHFVVTLTGAAHLIDRNNAYMVENMIQGFAFSVFLIAVLTLLVHRSWKMLFVFLLPNLIPLLVVSGFMGLSGIELKSATALVFSIAFGIATDDTIHFISRLKIELQYGKSMLYAFKRTYLETGKPILLTNFILVGGFITLLLSDFQSIFYFGLLLCLTLLVALLADLFLLPVLLLVFYKNTRYQTKAPKE